MKRYTRLIRLILRVALILIVMLLLLGSSSLRAGDHTERVRAYTRNTEFDFISWTLNALRIKLLESALGTSNYLYPDDRHQLVIEYLELMAQIQQAEWQQRVVYSDPNITNPHDLAAPIQKQLDELYARRERIEPVAESILQSQIAYVIAEMDLSVGGQVIPPVLYHSTPLPLALIVSPRDIIRQDENIPLVPDLSVEEQIKLEAEVDRNLNVSSLVERIGGVGTYPTMVQQTSYADWLSEVVAHEWVHNFLTLRPLGVNYLTSPELRVMNETTAAIAGKEIGRAVLEAFYPELLPPPDQGITPPTTAEPPAFDFRKEMHLTRITADLLLTEGKIEEAEQYMEKRRKIFWENGYRHLRKLNQAYFAFHGAYADEPGGAAGAAEDPVGAAVRGLRAQSPSLAAFLNRIAWMTSFQQLERAVEGS